MVEWHWGDADKGNLLGTYRTLDGADGDSFARKRRRKTGGGRTTVQRVPIRLGNGFLSRHGWAGYDDSNAPVIDPRDGWITARASSHRIDYYLLAYGTAYTEALADAAVIFGRQPLPPRWAFGYWYSRYWAYTDRDLLALAETFDVMKVPLDIMVIDMDWHLPGWTGYTWDSRYFPDPARTISDLHARGLKVTLNLHPADGVKRFEEAYRSMAEALGKNPESGEPVPFDCTDRRFMEAYFRLLHHPHEERGIDFWWIDWQQGLETRIPGLDPLPWLNRCHWEDMKRHAGQRPLILSRYGGIGSGKYVVGFSGDSYSTWNTLAYQPSFTATAANVLYGYWSHDIGGHLPGKVDAELYTRWVQLGAYSPILRTHTTKSPDGERQFWSFPGEYRDVMIEAVRERYRLLPYIYTEARRCYDSALSLVRPMYHGWPQDQQAYECPSQYLFGDRIIVRPVTSPRESDTHSSPISVWLPEGTWWDIYQGARILQVPMIAIIC